ncbi:hypothetical protein HRbin01_00300 [archaeon HR01]|nr:hypothetical protein HRbin01_00300 [archaeon HR01]
MRYYDAVKKGEFNAAKSQERLASYTGQAYAAMIVKEVEGGWRPVGEEDFYAVVKKDSGGYVVVLCDADGYAKALSPEMSRFAAEKCVEKMKLDGIQEYSGRLVLPL